MAQSLMQLVLTVYREHPILLESRFPDESNKHPDESQLLYGERLLPKSNVFSVYDLSESYQNSSCKVSTIIQK